MSPSGVDLGPSGAAFSELPALVAEPSGEQAKVQAEAQTLSLGNNKPDPHIWLDPLRMANLLPVIAETIASYTPEIRDEVHANAQRSARHLRATLVPEITRMLKTTIGRTGQASIFAAHPAYRYFTERFSLGAIPLSCWR